MIGKQEVIVTIDVDRLKQLLSDEDRFFGSNPRMSFWEDYEVGLIKKEARELYNAHMISIAYRSNKYTGYKCNRDVINDYIRQQETVSDMFKPEDGVPDDLFDSIVGYDDVKDRTKMILNLQTPFGLLMIGPPASAKSMFLMELSRLPGSRYITASSATKAGFSEILLEYEPDILLIDELDKASIRDYDALLSLLETGIVQQNKHGLHVQKVLHTKVFAACNTAMRIPPEIMSRFVPLKFKAYNMDDLREIGIAMLTKHEHINRNVAELIVVSTLELLGHLDPRDFLKIARLRTGNTPKQIDDTIRFVLKYR